jgi:hypothetical protein
LKGTFYVAVTEVVVEPGKEKEESSSGSISIDGMECRNALLREWNELAFLPTLTRGRK